MIYNNYICSVPIEKLARFRNQAPRPRTGCPVLEPARSFLWASFDGEGQFQAIKKLE